MAESPLAIRTTEDVKALFNELAEKGNFENKSDFLNRLLLVYQSEFAKEEASILKPAIETVETLTSRLLEVLTGAAATINTRDEKHTQELNEQKQSFDETRKLLQQRIEELQEEVAIAKADTEEYLADKEAAETKTNELLQQIEQLEGAIADKSALIDEYKAKNDTLNSIVVEYKAAAEENKSLLQESSRLEKKIEELESSIQHQKELAEINLEKKILELEKIKQAELKEQQSAYSKKLNEYEKMVFQMAKKQKAIPLAEETTT